MAVPYERSAEVYDLIYSAIKDYDAEAAQIHELVQRWAPEARTLLDVGCGTGRHLGAFRQWYSVAGADRSPSMVAVARERNPGVEVSVSDVRDLALGRRFDVVTFLFSGIAYLLDVPSITAGLVRLREHVAEGGVLVVDGWLRPDAVDPAYFTGALSVEADDMAVSRTDHHSVGNGRSVLDMHYSVVTLAGIESFDEHHELALLPTADYLQAFADAGLEVLEVTEGEPGRDRYVARSPREVR